MMFSVIIPKSSIFYLVSTPLSYILMNKITLDSKFYLTYATHLEVHLGIPESIRKI
jgi:hypothetical protein